MNTGKIIERLRKQQNWSQSELADKTNVSRVMIGKYEREEAVPSIEAAKSIADAFDVSLDYLVGEGQISTYNKEIIKRIDDIENLDEDTKNKLFFLIDNVIQNFKTKKAFAS